MQSAISVIYSDDNLLVVDKPAGLVTAPAETVKQLSLAELLAAQFSIDLERAGIVHRLDKDTSGLLLVARDQATLEALQQQFKARSVDKRYTALVHDIISDPVTVDQPILRNPAEREKFITHPDGRPALTEFVPKTYYNLTSEQLAQIFPDYSKIQMRKLLSSNYGQFTLLDCHPRTGRTHQLRVHLKYLNHSIVADGKYGGRKTTRLDHRICPRQFLHASEISFTHPVTGERMTFHSPLPQDLTAVLAHFSSSGE